MAFGASSHVGKVRKANQDYYYASEKERYCLYIVADGMGGHNAGEVASYLAINSIVTWIDDNILELYRNIDLQEHKKIEEYIKASIDFANTQVYQKALENTELFGMGTTITLALIIKNSLYIGHVGDSRAYMINSQRILQLTQDHSLVAELFKNGSITIDEAANHPQRHLLTRAIGTEKQIIVDTWIYKLEKDDLILLCTDGLTNLIDNNEIFDIVISNNISSSCERLIEYANNKGGSDNITAILIKCSDKL
jgi:PPM family protein phosphatase